MDYEACCLCHGAGYLYGMRVGYGTWQEECTACGGTGYERVTPLDNAILARTSQEPPAVRGQNPSLAASRQELEGILEGWGILIRGRAGDRYDYLLRLPPIVGNWRCPECNRELAMVYRPGDPGPRYAVTDNQRAAL